jgi:hypothetical protein
MCSTNTTYVSTECHVTRECTKSHVQVQRDTLPYREHVLRRLINSLNFCPITVPCRLLTTDHFLCSRCSLASLLVCPLYLITYFVNMEVTCVRAQAEV